MTRPAVKLDNVSMRFLIRHQKARSFQDALVNFIHRSNGSTEEFWALRDVSFEVQPGETLGIIGENGSGKSTILKLITRILEPTSGKVTVNGKVSALIELGAGFHPDLSGRENIYLNGSILGFSRKDMDRKFDEIVAFAELERFIDTPVKHYSSGMYARLGFSVAMSVDPDILIIDEVLSVGDEAFQRKCLDRINDFRKHDKAVIFVSHGLQVVEQLCDRVMWLHCGHLAFDGLPGPTILRYSEELQHREERLRATQARASSQDSFLARPSDDSASDATVIDVLPGSNEEEPKYVYRTGERVAARVRYRVSDRTARYVLDIEVRHGSGLLVYADVWSLDDALLLADAGHGEFVVEFGPMPLLAGTYEMSFGLRRRDHPARDWPHNSPRCTFSIWSDGQQRGIVALEGRCVSVRPLAHRDTVPVA